MNEARMYHYHSLLPTYYILVASVRIVDTGSHHLITGWHASIQMSAACKRRTHRIKHGAQPSNASEFMAVLLGSLIFLLVLFPKPPIVVIVMKAMTTRAFHLPGQAAHYRCTTTPLRNQIMSRTVQRRTSSRTRWTQ
jgi:hypothetical protein